MSLFDLSDVKNRPHRSSFDMRSKRVLTAKAGEIVPVWWTFTMPGDKFKIDQSWFTRTQPVQTSAYTRIREYFDFFYVPLRQLWKQAPQAIFQLSDNSVTASSSTQSTPVGYTLPCVTLSELDAIFEARTSSITFGESLNACGYKRGDCAAKLLRYLGYGNFRKEGYEHNYGTSVPKDKFDQTFGQNVSVNLFPVLTYQKIYNDIFRNSQWEKTAPYAFNVDYWKGSGTLGTDILNQALNPGVLRRTMFDIGYCNWNKDFITGVLPRQQLGEPASVYVSAVGGSTSISGSLVGKITGYGRLPVFGMYPQNNETAIFPSSSDVAPSVQGIGGDGSSTSPLVSGVNLYVKPDVSSSNQTFTLSNGSSVAFPEGTSSSFTVLAFRQAEALQKWKEIAMSGNQTYRDQVYRHFGVSLPSELSDTVHYIGGHASNINISEVVNTALSGESDEALIRGKGTGMGDGKGLSFSAKEYGVIMCVYHAVPLLDYQTSGQHQQLLTTLVEDLPVPEFDNLGLQAVPSVMLTNTPNTQVADRPKYLGYGPRYFQWKGDLDRVFGAFESTLRDWAAPFTDVYLETYLGTNVSSSITPLNYAFFKIDPAILNNIFLVQADGTWDTDVFLINSEFDVKVARNLSRTGLPY